MLVMCGNDTYTDFRGYGREVDVMRRWIVICGVGALAGLVGLEWSARQVLGLGDPPLYMAHPTIEYMLQPGRAYRRFGNDFKVNRYGMRSAEITPRREGNEVRLLVLGDSVPNGGSLTDQSELASEILKRALAEALDVSVEVGNISAGSWSPPNLAAYLKTFGTFDTDVAFVVLNRQDLHDVPRFAALKSYKHPTRKPLTATGELLNRYIIGRAMRAVMPKRPPPDHPRREEMEQVCLDALSDVIAMLRRSDCRVVILYHPARDEVGADGRFDPDPMYARLRVFATGQAVHIVCPADRYGDAIKASRNPYRDAIHLSRCGQDMLAAEMLAILRAEGWIDAWRERS